MASNSGFALWLTGMSGAGKSTLAEYIEARLRQVGRAVEVLDEREFEGVLWEAEAENKEQRVSHDRRLAVMANLLARNQVATLIASVSPYKSIREENRRLIGRYVEVYVDCPTEKLIARDSTGRYKKALAGEIPNFIGITEPYEPPTSAEVVIRSDTESVEEGGLRIFQALLDLGYVSGEDLKIITGRRLKANPAVKKAHQAKAAGKSSGKVSANASGTKARPVQRAAKSSKPAPKTAAKRRK
ncbi:MAG: adenylyl-sulfate kinase [Myxococcaceae bacterium]